MPTDQPLLQLQPPTPSIAKTPDATSDISTTSLPMLIPPPNSRPTSRGGAATSSLSRSSSRHHPYGASPASLSSSNHERSFRQRSATGASDRSDWESEASTYETDHDLRSHSSPDQYDLASLDFPFLADTTLPQPPLPFSYHGVSRRSPKEPVTDVASKASKTTKTKKSHARKTAPGHIKRPPNAFILFRSHCCGPKNESNEPDPPGTAHARHLASLDINNSQHVSLIVSQIWKGMKPDDKAYWEQKAQEAKEEHQRLYPEYRYKPQPRAKETIRKRKKADPMESREHRDACHEVARIVLEQDAVEPSREHTMHLQLELPIPPVQPTGRGRANLTEDIIDGRVSSRASPQALPARRSTRKTKSNQPISDDSSPPSLGLPTPPTLSEPFSHFHDNSFSSNAPHLEQYQFDQEHVTYSSSSYESSPFAYMARLERHTAKEARPDSAFYTADPKYGVLGSHADGTALHPLSSPPETAVLQPAPNLFPFSRPPSPTSDAIRQMQSYSLSGPSPPSRPQASLPPLSAPSSSRDISQRFGTSRPQLDSQAWTRDIRYPAELDLSALKHRRSTLRPEHRGDSSGRGDIMLISPLTSTFDGRRSSASWSSGIRRVSGSLPALARVENGSDRFCRKSSLSIGAVADTTAFETLAFSQDILETFPIDNTFFDANFLANNFEPAELSGGEEEIVSDRPSTASTSWSADDDFGCIERLEAGFPSGFFDRRRSTLVASKLTPPQAEKAETADYHIEATRLFSTPQHPFAAFDSHHTQAVDPAFGSEEFSTSCPPLSHRPSFSGFFKDPFSTSHENNSSFFPNVDTSSHTVPEHQPTLSFEASCGMALPIAANEPALSDSPVQAQPSKECEYVLLSFDQLGDTDLMTRLHEQGYGVAFETASLDDNVSPQGQSRTLPSPGSAMTTNGFESFPPACP